MPRYEFGPFQLDLHSRVLLRDGEAVPMAGKTLDTLAALVQNRGRLMEKDELLSLIWPGIVVEEASLSQSIFTVRKILGDSPRDRRYIATVPGRGYQFVGPVAEVVSLKPALESVGAVTPGKRHYGLAVWIAGVIVVAAGVFWYMPHRSSGPTSELVERRLTFNSSANEISSAVISPDGKYLAYTDPAGMHLRLLSTGEERFIPTLGAVPAGASVLVDSWFPNGTELLVHSREVGGRGNMWSVSTMGKSLRNLRDNASGWDVSRDGKRIAFSPNRASGEGFEIWVMDKEGDGPHKVLSLPADEFMWSVHWSAEGNRLAYIRAKESRQSMETCDLKGENRAAVVVAPGQNQWVRSLWWLPDKRIVYSQAEAADVEANLWQVGVDAAGKPTGKPKRITRWAKTDALGLSASADGTRLSLQKVTYPAQIYVGELAGEAASSSPPQQITHDEAHDWATAWTADSKAVIFTSDRGGRWGIFKQKIAENAVEPLVEGRENVDLPRLSPDGAWVLYAETSTSETGSSTRHRLMRVAVNGGLPKVVLDTSPVRWDDHSCTRAPANLCVIIETIHQEHVTITAFDPLKGRGKLLRAFEKHAHEAFNDALSPDGSTLALAKSDESDMHIRLLSLTGGQDREIKVKGWPNNSSMEWSADGKGVYCGSSSPESGTLLYVDLKGNARAVWRCRDVGGGAFIGGVPSPDGRYMALTGGIRDSNAWMIEGF